MQAFVHPPGPLNGRLLLKVQPDRDCEGVYHKFPAPSGAGPAASAMPKAAEIRPANVKVDSKSAPGLESKAANVAGAAIVPDGERAAAAAAAATAGAAVADESMDDKTADDPDAAVLLASWNTLASEYTRWNTSTKAVETSAQKLRRWQQIVQTIARVRPTILCGQEFTYGFLRFAFAAKPRKGAKGAASAPAAGAAAAEDTPDGDDDVRADSDDSDDESEPAVEGATLPECGALLSSYHFVWLRRTYSESHIYQTRKQGGKTEPKQDGCAILFRRARFHAPWLAPLSSRASDDASAEAAALHSDGVSTLRRETLTSEMMRAEAGATPYDMDQMGAMDAMIGSPLPLADTKRKRLYSLWTPSHFVMLKSSGDPRNGVSIALRAKGGTHDNQIVAVATCVHLEGDQKFMFIAQAQLHQAQADAKKLTDQLVAEEKPTSLPIRVLAGDLNFEAPAEFAAQMQHVGLFPTVVSVAPQDADSVAGATADAVCAATLAGNGAAKGRVSAALEDVFEGQGHVRAEMRERSNTSIFGQIDGMFVSDQKRLDGMMRVLPRVGARVLKPAGAPMASSVQNARASRYRDPPYDNDSWPSDHYLVLQKISKISA
jgi:hypothetical protein